MEIRLSSFLLWLALLGFVLANENGSEAKNKEASKTEEGMESYDETEETRLNEAVEKRRTSKYDPALKYQGLGKRQPPTGSDVAYAEEDAINRASKYPLIYLNSKKSGSRSKFDPAYNFMGLGKRKKPSKFDPAMKFMGLGKRQESGSDVTDDVQIERVDYPLQYDNYQKRKKPSKFDPAMKFMGLGKRQDSEDVGGEDYPTQYDNYQKRKMASKYDPGMKFMGLGKRQRTGSDIVAEEEMVKRGYYKYDGYKRKKPSKFDPGMRFMGLGKRQSAGSDVRDQERNFEARFIAGQIQPHPSSIATVVKRSPRPRYDPGWKFIGLGKRGALEDDFEEPENDEVTLKNPNPYLGALALQNLTRFFEEVRHSLSDEPRRYADTSSSSEEWSPLYLPESPNHNSQYSGYVRARKPSSSGGYNLGLISRNKPLYDPSWSLTGLGK